MRNAVSLMLGAFCAAAVRLPAQDPPYDPATVETLAGEVTAVERHPAEKVPGRGVRVILKSQGETLAVHLGPEWYVAEQEIQLAAGNRIVVTGSRVQAEGRPAILAARVRKDQATLQLRDEQGVPRWPAWRGKWRDALARIQVDLSRAAALSGAGERAKARAALQEALQALDALTAAVGDLEANVSVEQYLAPLLEEARRGMAGLKPKDRLRDVRDHFSVVKVRVAEVRRDSMEELAKDADPAAQAYARKVSGVLRALGLEGERVTVNILEAPQVGAEAMPRTLRGRLFPNRKRRDLRPGATLEVRLEPKQTGSLQQGDDCWLVLSPALTAEAVPLLVGGAGRTHVLHVVKVK